MQTKILTACNDKLRAVDQAGLVFLNELVLMDPTK
jgi:hypothetical protein